MADNTEIPEGWVETSLGEIIVLIGGGTPKTTIDDYWNGKIPWLSVVDFNNDSRWVLKTEKTITEKGLIESSTKLLKSGDLIISARGTVGILAQLKKDMAFNQSCYGIQAKKNISDIDFLYYLIRFEVKQISKNVHGAVFDTITRDTFDSIKITIPPIPEQQVIARMLSSFDDKIELLREQNETLEKTAQTIFQEWFGKYGVEDELPEGWRVKKIKDFVEHIKISIIPQNNSNIYFLHYSIPAFDNGEKAIKEKGETIMSNKYQVVENCFLVSKLNPKTPRIWTIFSAGENAICSTEFQVIKPIRQEYFSFIYGLLNSKYFTDKFASGAHGTSSSHQRAMPEDILNIEIIVCNDEVIFDFNTKISPLIKKISSNNSQIQSLSKTRDELLPRLMSGEIRV